MCEIYIYVCFSSYTMKAIYLFRREMKRVDSLTGKDILTDGFCNLSQSVSLFFLAREVQIFMK